jgi:hypothetical protein
MAVRTARMDRRMATALGLFWLTAAGGPAVVAQPVDPTLAGLPAVAQLPPGTVKISPVVPGMGEHWAKLQDLPLGLAGPRWVVRVEC